MPSFDKENAVRLWKPRPLNMTFDPIAGDDWLYFDADKEGVVKWHIERLEQEGDKTLVHLSKASGVDIGYKAVYPIAKMEHRKWRPVDESKGARFLWPCPSCEKDRPIMPGDYLCETCRNDGVDNDDPNPYSVGDESD